MMQTEILFPFLETIIAESAAKAGGVYTLYDKKKKIIYYGKAQKQGISERLLSHTNPESDCLDSVHYFSFEVTNNPEKRYAQLLRKYQNTNGKLPDCNERMESVARREAQEFASSGVLTNAFLGN